MLTTMKSILDAANRDNYAVMAVNSINLEIVRAVINAANDKRSPIIVQMGPSQMKKHAYPEDMAPMVKRLAEEAKVSVALNLDHGSDLDTIILCIQYGFTNIMIDASSLPYEENIKRTRLIVDLAHQKGVSVEAELGHVGQANIGDYSNVDLLTNVDQAYDFVNKTGVDALAVAFGTAHGSYPEGYIPKLDFERLAQIKEKLKMPLVMHGGSGSGDENVKKAVKNGINKINVCTDVFKVAKQAMLNKVKEDSKADFLEISVNVENEVYEFVSNYIDLIGSANRYIFNGLEQKVYE